MALAQYTDTFWFPNGTPAASIAATVFPRNSSIPATLYTDATGTTTLPNPTPTNGSGTLSFWAETGDYWVHLDTETFGITVGMSQEQADLSTGVASGGEISANALDPSAVDIGAVDGYIVDYIAGDQAEPVITRVKTPGQTVPMDAAALARAVTYWLLDSTGTVIQQAAKPDPEQRRTHILLGVTAHTGGVIGVEQTLPVILPGVANQLTDLMEALGAFNISGNIISPNGANLQFNHGAGTMFARAFNHYNNGVLTRNPHVCTTQAQTPAQFIQITRSATTAPPITSTLDVANYDNAGVITPIGGGSGSSSSLANATAAIGANPSFVVNPTFNSGNGALIAYIAVTRTATNLSDPSQATIVAAGKFAAP